MIHFLCLYSKMSSHHIFDLSELAERIEKIHLLGIKFPDHFLTKTRCETAFI